MVKFLFLNLFTFFYLTAVFSQNIVLDDNNDEVYDCAISGVHLVNQGANYPDNTSYIKTICTNGLGLSIEAVSGVFGSIGDYLCVYDGDDINTAPIIACFTISSPMEAGTEYRTSTSNTSGCMTFQFFSDSDPTGGGSFDFLLDCKAPCKEVYANIDSLNPQGYFENGYYYVNSCPGDSILFGGSGFYPTPGGYAQSDATSNFYWDFGDGTLDTGQFVYHTFEDGRIYPVSLVVEDINECKSINETEVRVRKSGPPNIIFELEKDILCIGDTIDVWGNVENTPIGSDILFDTLRLGSEASVVDTVFLPDDSNGSSGDGIGETVIYNLPIFGYQTGTTLSNINDLLSVCIDIEHSFVGDLDIRLECPNGQSIYLVDMDPPGTPGDNLGIPGNPNNSPGDGFLYCWSPSAIGNGDTISPADNYPVVNGAVDSSVIYTPQGDWSGLLGCPMNGNWNIIVFDDYGGDNGYCFGASIQFNPAYLAINDSFLVSFDTAWWNANPVIVSNTGSVEDTLIQAYANDFVDDNLIFNVQNNLGCVFQDTVLLNVFNVQTTALQDATLCFGDTLDAQILLSGNDVYLPPVCTYTLDLFDSWGDGWNGGELEVFADGVSIGVYTITTGTSGSFDVEVPSNTVVDFEYTAGSFNGEVSYDIIDASTGSVLFSAGPGPASGITYSTTCNVPGQGLPAHNPYASVADIDTVCTFELNAIDDWGFGFGDGWDNAEVEVLVNNSSFGSYNTTGTISTYNLSFNYGDEITLVYNRNGETFNSEVSYNAVYSSGSLIYDSGFDPADGTSYTFIIDDLASCNVESYVIYDFGTSAFNQFTSGDSAYAQIVANSTQDVIFTTTFSSGCTYEDTITITVPEVTYQLLGDQEICQGDSVQLTAFGAETYEWTPNDGSLNDTTIAAPTATPSATTMYYVIVRDINGCGNIDSVEVVVNPSPQTTINNGANPLTICAGSPINLYADQVANWDYEWTNENNDVIATTYEVVVNEGGTYTLNLIDQNNPTGCQSNFTVTVNENPLPEFNLIDLRNVLCCNDSLILDFDALVSNGVTLDRVYWNGNINPVAGPIRLTSNQNGTVTYSIRAIDINGCESISTIDVTTACNSGTIEAIDTLFQSQTHEYQILNSLNNTDYVWYPAGRFTGNTFNADSAGLNTISVDLINQFVLNNGTDYSCIETDSTTVYVVEVSNPEMPNAFTPNGDGLNDLFFPVYLDNNSNITTFNIYNRWGELVYQYNSDNGWDGTYQGKDQPTDVYNYYIVIDKITENYIISGSVSLFR